MCSALICIFSTDSSDDDIRPQRGRGKNIKRWEISLAKISTHIYCMLYDKRMKFIKPKKFNFYHKSIISSSTCSSLLIYLHEFNTLFSVLGSKNRVRYDANPFKEKSIHSFYFFEKRSTINQSRAKFEPEPEERETVTQPRFWWSYESWEICGLTTLANIFFLCNEESFLIFFFVSVRAPIETPIKTQHTH